MSSLLMMRNPEEAADLAGALLHACPGRRVFALRGELGAGKTTLIKALCRELGVEEGTASPSYAIVHEYHKQGSEPVYHFDLHRLKDTNELEAIGFHEYLESGHYCFVEWPELAGKQLPPGTVDVQLRVANGGRTVQIDLAPEPRQR